MTGHIRPGRGDDASRIPAIIRAQAIEGFRSTRALAWRLGLVAEQSLDLDDYLLRAKTECRDSGISERPLPKPLWCRLRPRPPYEHPRFPVLDNRPGIISGQALAEFEARASSVRMLMELTAPSESMTAGFRSAKEILSLHGRLFGDVYAWAGQVRTVGIAKGGVRFAAPPDIIDHLESAVRSLARLGESDSPGALASFLAHYLWAHPFREGNGRTATTILMCLTGPAGVAGIEPEEWHEASRRSLAVPGHPNPEPWLAITSRLITAATPPPKGNTP